MPLLDFDSLVICNKNYDISALTSTLEFFRELGIRKFIVTIDVDPLRASQYDVLNKYRDFKQAVLTQARPRSSIIRVAPSVLLEKDISLDPFLQRLRLSRTNKIFIRSPLLQDKSWTPEQLNYLLYKQKLKPIFVNFEYNLLSPDHEYRDQLYRIEKAAYCLDINFMTKKLSEKHLKHALREDLTIIPAVSNPLYAYDGSNRHFVIDSFNELRDRIGSRTYLKICKQINVSTKKIFTFHS